ncbi:DNA-directed RNA polymerase subunit alpha [Salmon gill poxvirus]|uniref:DNA-directed RNA polymerase 147 kDa polypeptide n=1 Tax=Salmon gill poxvirus TaxID=1680908 RepID=A0A0H4YFQ4_9POXV|nr:DNA-directed RNA polymerase subunit alpha [Salmon gill poxvirus]AKR04289.1 DNA-directed RNA polymerase subunit alpha [Salmon gill poxvirus]
MRPITSIEFGLYTNDEIERSEISIKNSKSANDHETVKDKRLGTVDNNLCKTCRCISTLCLGHWGKVGIKNVYIRPSHVNQIIQISNYLCLHCGVFKLKSAYETSTKIALKHHDDKNNKIKIKELAKSILDKKSGICWNESCQQKYVKISFNKKKKICFTWKSKENKLTVEQEYPLQKLFEMFKSIPALYYPMIGVKVSPENLFYEKNIPIPPMLIRPPNSFWLDDVKKETHELTILMTTLINQIKSNSDSMIIQKALIEYDNSNILSAVKQNNNSLVSILVGKNNMLRWHILSGRKDQTCRTVVGPDSQLLLWEIGVPDMVLSKLSSKIFVNPFSIEKIVNLFRAGQVKIYFNKQTNRLMTLKKDKKLKGQVTFKPGDWVEIDLQEGDHMIFGRQPSLHRHNVISSCIKRVEGCGLKIPQVICNSQNADFDGDEIWGCLEQHPKATIEQSILMFPVTIILHDLLGIPLYGNIQDEIISAHLLGTETELTLTEVNYLFKQCPHLRQLALPKGQKYFTGKNVLSIVFNQNKKNLTLPGILKDGQIIIDNIGSDLIVGQKTKSLSKLIIETSSRLEGCKFINDIGRLLRQYLRFRQYGVIFTDLLPDYAYVRTLNNNNLDKLFKIKSNFARYIRDCEDGKIIRLDEQTENKYIDTVLMSLVKSNICSITKFIETQLEINPRNSLYVMSKAGYKMNPTEMMYIFGTFGQQKIGGKKMSTGVNSRILPYHLPGSLDPECRGFVLNPLLVGLTGIEYYFTMATARSQIVDIVCETSRTGSLARKILKKMEDVVVNELGYVICNKNILKFACNDIKMSKQDTTKIPIITPKPSQKWYSEIKHIWNTLAPYLTTDNKRNKITQCSFMLNLDMFLQTNKSRVGKPVESNTLFKQVNEWVDMITQKYFFNLSDTTMIRYTMLTYLDPSRYPIDSVVLNDLFENIENRFIYSLSSGYPVGVIFAQTLSEKFTQQALSNFHTTAKSGGVAATLGFDKFLKLVSLTKNTKAEVITFTSKTKAPLEILQNNFQFVCLDQLCPVIKTRVENTKMYIEMTFDRKHLKSENIQIPQLEIMIETFFNKIQITGQWSYWTEILDKRKFIIRIITELEEPVSVNQYILPMMLPGGIYKGKICDVKFPIDKIQQWEYSEEHDEHKQVDAYKLIMILDSTAMLTKFDLSGIDVNPGIWTSYFGFGIESVRNKLINEMLETYGNGFDYLYQCCNLLADVMCHYYYPETANNFKMTKISIMKKMASGDYKSVAQAAVSGAVDVVQDNSTCHFLCQPIKVGTGFFDYYTDINDFLPLVAKKSTIEDIKETTLDLIGF